MHKSYFSPILYPFLAPGRETLKRTSRPGGLMNDKISIATILRAETIRAPIGAPIEVVIGLIVRDPEDIDTMIFRFYYTGIRVRDLKKSLDFYTGVIGLKVVGKGTDASRRKVCPPAGKGLEADARA